jgi:hypothetical protein
MGAGNLKGLQAGKGLFPLMNLDFAGESGNTAGAFNFAAFSTIAS